MNIWKWFYGGRRAFTMIEVLIVVAVIAIISAFVLPSFLGGSHQADLNGSTQAIVASLRDAQSQAVGDVKSATWGIHFSNTTNTAPFYAVFSGSTYSTSTVTNIYRLPATVAFVTSTLPVGSSLDVTFSPITGAASVPYQAATSTGIGLYVISQPSLSSTISIAMSGAISAGGTASPTIPPFGTIVKQIGCFSGDCPYTSTNGGTGYPGQFAAPEDMAFDASGNIWVADSNNSRVQEFNALGNYLAQFPVPFAGDLAIDQTTGNIWSAGNGILYEYTSGGTQLYDDNGFAYPFNNILSHPDGVALDASGNVWVSVECQNIVLELSSTGSYISSFTPQNTHNVPPNSCSGGLAGGIAIDSSGNVWITDYDLSNSVGDIEEYNASGAFLSSFDSPPGSGGDFPQLLTIDSANHIWLPGAGVIEEFNESGTLLASIPSDAFGIGIDSHGNIWGVSLSNNRVVEYSSGN